MALSAQYAALLAYCQTTYPGQTAAAIVPQLNTPVATPIIPSDSAVVNALMTNGDWGNLTVYSRGTISSYSSPTATDKLVQYAISSLAVLQTFMASSVPSVLINYLGTALEALQAAGIISLASLVALGNLSSGQESWAQSNGWPNGVTISDLNSVGIF